MGKMKTDRSITQAHLKKAHAMAEAFAENKAEGFLKTFLENSDITVSEEAHELVKSAFLGALALSYAMGYMDCAQNKTIKTLYVPQGTEGAKDQQEKPHEEPPQLILPGSAKW